jgi:hypothetical protein
VPLDDAADRPAQGQFMHRITPLAIASCRRRTARC